jgi:hypothetical protein
MPSMSIRLHLAESIPLERDHTAYVTRDPDSKQLVLERCVPLAFEIFRLTIHEYLAVRLS